MKGQKNVIILPNKNNQEDQRHGEACDCVTQDTDKMISSIWNSSNWMKPFWEQRCLPCVPLCTPMGFEKQLALVCAQCVSFLICEDKVNITLFY